MMKSARTEANRCSTAFVANLVIGFPLTGLTCFVITSITGQRQIVF